MQGRESQNTDSTSYLNHAEAQEVVARVTELLDNWPDEWGPKDPRQVAVISTYSDQVCDSDQLGQSIDFVCFVSVFYH